MVRTRQTRISSLKGALLKGNSFQVKSDCKNKFVVAVDPETQLLESRPRPPVTINWTQLLTASNLAVAFYMYFYQHRYHIRSAVSLTWVIH